MPVPAATRPAAAPSFVALTDSTAADSHRDKGQLRSKAKIYSQSWHVARCSVSTSSHRDTAFFCAGVGEESLVLHPPASRMTKITGMQVYDWRFPTSIQSDGSDAVHKDPDVSALSRASPHRLWARRAWLPRWS
jgi:hypothetical protein